MAQRPEHLDPPEILYKEYEARNTNITWIIDILIQMCERAIELLALPEDEKSFILDVGCGSELSGSVLEDQGNAWMSIGDCVTMNHMGRKQLQMQVV